MAMQVEWPGGDMQWLRGDDPRLPVSSQAVPIGCKIISQAPDNKIDNWSRRPAPFAELYDGHVRAFRTHEWNWMRREYMRAGERF